MLKKLLVLPVVAVLLVLGLQVYRHAAAGRARELPPRRAGAASALNRITDTVILRDASGMRGAAGGRTPDVAAETGGPKDAQGPAPRQATDAIPGEYVFAFYSEADRAAFERVAAALGATVLGRGRLGNSLRLRIDSDAVLRDILARGPAPVSSGPNIYIRRPPEPFGSDPRAPVAGYVGFGSGAARWLGVPADNGAWGAGVTVAVLDSGVGSHRSLDPARVSRESMLEVPGDEGWHGTAVASLIAGNGDGVQGVAPGAEIMSIQVLNENGQGDIFTLAQAIVDAVDRGADIINLSLGAYSDSFMLAEAVAYAQEQDVLVVAATGNDGVEGLLYPARYDGVLAPGAVDATGQHAYFSNRGEEVDVTAPGIGVTAASTNDQLVLFSGTSAATPLVSGAAAALLSMKPDMSAEELAEALTDYSNDAGAPGHDPEYGDGLLDVARAATRDVPGIYDVAVGTPWLPPDATTGPSMVFYVQNRGTEVLASVDLRVEIDGVPAVLSFYNLDVGATATRAMALNDAALRSPEGVRITGEAVIDGVEDAVPSNNRFACTVSR